MEQDDNIGTPAAVTDAGGNAAENSDGTSAGAAIGDGADPSPDGGKKAEPDTVPYERFREVNERAKKAQALADELQKAEAEREEKRKIAAGEHEKVIGELKPKAERAEILEESLKSFLAAEMEAIPEERRGLVPDSLPVEEQLSYISRNRASLMGNAGKSVNNGPNPSSNQQSQPTFTLAQINDPVFFQKNKDAIKQAFVDGRIAE